MSTTEFTVRFDRMEQAVRMAFALMRSASSVEEMLKAKHAADVAFVGAEAVLDLLGGTTAPDEALSQVRLLKNTALGIEAVVAMGLGAAFDQSALAHLDRRIIEGGRRLSEISAKEPGVIERTVFEMRDQKPPTRQDVFQLLMDQADAIDRDSVIALARIPRRERRGHSRADRRARPPRPRERLR